MKISYSSIEKTITRYISRNTGIRSAAILEKNRLEALGMDQVDLVNLIMAVEKKYHITIPDEVPLHTVRDIIHYVYYKNAA